MTISKFAISRPVTTTMFFVGIVLLGVVSYHNLPVQLLPDVALPRAGIYARYRGLSVPETVDKLTKPLEAIVAATPHVHEIDSYTYAGFTRIHITFDFGTNMRFATLDLREKVARFQKTLPRRRVWARVRAFGTERMQTFFMWIIVRGKENREEIRRIAEDILQPQLEAIDGVAEVRVGGYYRETIDVVFDRDKLVAHNLGLGKAISRISQATGDAITLGRLRGPHENYFFTLGETIADEQDLAQLPLDDRGVVRLRDVATIYRNQHKSDWVSRINGKNFVGVLVRKEADVNPLRLAGKVRRTLHDIESQLPPGYTVSIEEDAAEIIERIIRQVGILAVVGALLAMFVLMLFVRNFRMAAIVFAAIPISVIATFNLMYFGGLSLNIVTLVGLAVGIGMLVDNAIVVLENIFRHFERGRHALEASENATDEVWRALLATTLTNVVVFTPILFSEGEIRLIFREGALAIIFPVVVSLVVALTLVPMVASKILSGRERRGAKRRRFARLFERTRDAFHRWYPYWPSYMRRPRRLYREFYMALLRAALRHRVRLLLLTILAIVLTIHVCLPNIGKGRMRRRHEGGSFPVFVQVPKGSTRDHLVRVLDVVERRLRRLPELDKTRSWGNVEEGATVWVKLVPKGKRKRTIDEVRERVLDLVGEVPGATLSLRPFEAEGTSPEELGVSYSEGGVVEVHGVHWEALEWVAEGLARQLELVPGIAQVEVETMRGTPEMEFVIDRHRSALFNVTASELASYFQTSQRGGQFSEITMERGDRKLDVRLRMGRLGHPPEEEEEGARPLAEVRSLEVLSPFGGAIPLEEIGMFRRVRGERRLHRRNLQYSLNLVYLLEQGADRKMVGEAVRSLLEGVSLPAGYSAEIAGEEKKIEENIRQVWWMLGITALLIYMVMASVFESFLSPLVIMISLPLAAVGVLWGLALTHSPFEELAMLGSIILAGIVVNNGIVMMDFISMLRRERGMSRTGAIVTACRARLRPILMTALTTILGLLPMALRTDEDVKWSGLAIVVISGLAVSTLLTLVVIPSMLMNLEDALAFLARPLKYLWRRRWVLYFLWPSRMRAKRLELAPASAALGPAAPTFDLEMRRQAALEATERGSKAPALRRAVEEAPEPAPSIVVRNVRMVYPVFRPRRFLSLVPSPRYKYGIRPPEGIDALRRVTLSIERGMFGLLGPNGAGKTTLLKIIAGLMRPTYGYVEVNGRDMSVEADKARREIGYLPQSFGLYGRFTARDYLLYHSLLLGIRGREERRRNVEAVLDQVGLLDVADEQVAAFSGGMRQRLGIARLLLTLPSVIIVDEPTAGLDPIERVKLRVLLSRLAKDRVVLLSTHIVDDISTSCRRMAVLHKGAVVYEGTPAGLRDSARGRIWEYVGGFKDESLIKERFRLLYKKAAGRDRVLFRFIADECDLPGARPVEPSLEDAYVLLTSM